MEKTSEQAKQVAGEILKQLGGNKFIAMTGVTNLVYGEKIGIGAYLQMKLRRNQKGYTHLVVQYHYSMDVYSMEFLKVDKYGERKVVELIHPVYDDDLVPTFEEQTGYNTHL